MLVTKYYSGPTPAQSIITDSRWGISSNSSSTGTDFCLLSSRPVAQLSDSCSVLICRHPATVCNTTNFSRQDEGCKTFCFSGPECKREGNFSGRPPASYVHPVITAAGFSAAKHTWEQRRDKPTTEKVEKNTQTGSRALSFSPIAAGMSPVKETECPQCFLGVFFKPGHAFFSNMLHVSPSDVKGGDLLFPNTNAENRQQTCT